MEPLHPLEHEVLSSIGKGDSIDKIYEKTNLNRDKIRRALQWLKTKGLISLKEEIIEEVRLTKTGKSYVKEGLPETQFLRLLPATFKELRSKLTPKEFNVSMGMLKREDKIKIEGDIIKITEEGKRQLKVHKGDELLSKILSLKVMGKLTAHSKEEQNIINFLKKRGIVEIIPKRIHIAAITTSGRKTISKIVCVSSKTISSDARIVQDVERLTHRMLSTGSWKDKTFRPYNISDPVSRVAMGKKQPYRRFLDELKTKLISLGFKQMSGPIVEMSFFNCDALYMPQNHVARGIHDLYFIEEPRKGSLVGYQDVVEKVAEAHETGGPDSTGWGYKFSTEETRKLVLRSQGTSLSARWLMDKPEIPGKYFAMVRCFRPDVVDATHNAEFFQVEGIILGEKLGLRDLFGVLKMFATEVAGIKKYKITPGYFPFTEPSAELHGWFNGKWIEIGGSGIFRPELTRPLGVEVPVIAWGLGLDRQFMMAKGIKDVRDLFSQDIDWLREATV